MSNAEQSTAAPGWYDDGHGRYRWWDGSSWSEHYAGPVPKPAILQTPAPVVVTNVTAPRKFYKTSHGFHLVMSIITLGAWLPVWLIVGLVNAARA